MQGALDMLATRASKLLHQHVRALVILTGVAFGVEVAQYVPEVFLGAHAFGEVIRNLAYALIGAVVFHWLVVEIPIKRQRRATYAFHEQSFRVLLIAGPGLLHMYQKAAQLLGEELDIWDKASLTHLATRLNAVAPINFGPQRVGLLRATVDQGIPRCLAEVSRSASYLDPDVAHALSQYPIQDGITMLQVRTTPSGGIEPPLDVHITWSLLESARRLYPALLDAGAYPPSIFTGHVDEEPLSAEVLIKDKPH